MQEQEPTKLEKRLDRIDRKYLKKVERGGRRNLTRLIIGALAVSAFTGYWGDVHQNLEAEAKSSVGITVTGEAHDQANNNSAIVFFNGFNTTDSVQLSHDMGPVVQQLTDGETWSVNYGNASLNPEKTAAAILDEARIRNIHKLTVVGYSEGAIDATESTRYIMENQYGPQVQALVIISGAYGYDELRPNQQAELDLAQAIKPIPGIDHSTVARFLSELYLKRKQGNIITNSIEVAKAISDKKLTSTALLAAQIFNIVEANLTDEFRRIGDVGVSKQLPFVLYVGTANPGYDYFVNDKLAAEKYGADTKAANLNFSNVYVPGAVHTRTDLAHDEYIRTIGDVSIEDAAKIASAHSFYEFMNLRIPTKIPMK